MRRGQRGFALIAAIVLIVVLAALAGFVASIVSGQGADQQLERRSREADLAAQAGLEWGAYQVTRPGPLGCQPTANIALPGSLSTVTVTVNCAQIGSEPLVPGPGTVNVYRIQSTAFSGVSSDPDYVERVKTGVFNR